LGLHFAGYAEQDSLINPFLEDIQIYPDRTPVAIGISLSFFDNSSGEKF
jgi:hypothetical protein